MKIQIIQTQNEGYQDVIVAQLVMKWPLPNDMKNVRVYTLEETPVEVLESTGEFNDLIEEYKLLSEANGCAFQVDMDVVEFFKNTYGTEDDDQDPGGNYGRYE